MTELLKYSAIYCKNIQEMQTFTAQFLSGGVETQ